ncbi:MAG TPA: electron transfer flavoprotein subunit beta/FixA family protein [Patescibacteria group bacterium]|nr:electron transfer flavoprotein subunit beta/FixA family protein [Patescibacteria group bacterium]
MKVIVCFKEAPDLERMAPADWETDAALKPDTRFVPTVLNVYDESALEMALRLRDAARGREKTTELIALTVDSVSPPRMLKNLLALQYDRVVKIESSLDLRFHALAVAKLLAAFIKTQDDAPVIFCGVRSNEGDNGKTPLLLAEMLGIPCITPVIDATLAAPDESLDVTVDIDGWRVGQRVRAPVVLAVGNVAGSSLRIPTLKDKMRVKGREPEMILPAGIDVEEIAAVMAREEELVSLKTERQKRDTAFVRGQDMAETAAIFYNQYLKKRAGI